MIVTLLTDFGSQDTFVGVMKGVIKGIAPRADIVDLTHHVPPQDIEAGAFALKTAYRFFPAGTIHVAVVDPGVGGPRLPVAASVGDFVYVAPDNGLLSWVLAENALHEAVTLDDPQYHLSAVSRTFHGRDIFAPVAAHLANGEPLARLGTALSALTTLTLPQPETDGDCLRCHVLYADVYGNLFTDLTEGDYDEWAAAPVTVEAGGRIVPGPRSYNSVSQGSPLALFGSSGYLEIAVRGGNARHTLGLARGDAVTLRRRGVFSS